MKRHDLFDVAAARALAEGLPFAGTLTPREAHQLASEGAATIVDIRTRPEWEFVGHIEDTPLIEWKSYGSSRPDPAFVDKLAARFAMCQPNRQRNNEPTQNERRPDMDVGTADIPCPGARRNCDSQRYSQKILRQK